MSTSLTIVDSVNLTCLKQTVHLKPRKNYDRSQENKSLIKKIIAILTSVASLFSLISASFSRRKMRLVADPTYSYIFIYKHFYIPPVHIFLYIHFYIPPIKDNQSSSMSRRAK